MKSFFKPVLLTCMLASVGLTAFSQTPAMGDHPGMMGAGGPMHEGMEQHRMGKMDPAKVQARMERRQAALKAALKLTPSQEGAWTTFTAAMKPPADLMAKRPDFDALAKLPTPERIDKMKALHAQHITEMTAAMDKRGEATKAFYATLTPEQQKTFDASTARRPGNAEHMIGPRGGKGPAQPKP
jgi:Spy/CpxP family protein refolding chaperone